MIPTPMYSNNPTARRIALGAAVVSAVFSLIAAVAIAAAFFRDQTANPLAAVELPRLKSELINRPDDSALKDQIRQLDLQVRRDYFARRQFIRQGSYLLLGGLVAFAIALKFAARFSQSAPTSLDDFSTPADPWKSAPAARLAILSVAVISAGLLAIAAFLPGGHRHEDSSPVTAAPPPSPARAWPSDEELARNWPSFRGIDGSGVVASASLPSTWNGAAGTNILWKSPVPLPGKNSPIVWDNRIFLTGANTTAQKIFCFDADTGSLLWSQPVSTSPSVTRPEVFEDTGHAPSTMATDGSHVFAIFPTGDLAAFDFTGRKLWAINLDSPKSQYGYAASLALAPDRLIVQFDQGSDASEKLSALIALNPASGQILWKTPRPVPNSWASPVVIRTPAGLQIITAANPWVIAYAPQDGHELWRVKCLDGDVAASPTYAAGKVFVANDRAKVAAIKPDGQGDVTATHLLWSAEDGLPDMVSPLATADILLLVTSSGTLTCYDSQNGKKLWSHDIEGNFSSSPVLVGQTIHLTDGNGVTHFLHAGREYKELGTASVGEAVHASPALVRNRIIIRAQDHLFCIGTK